MIKWYDFKERKPKQGHYLAYVDIAPPDDPDCPSVTLGDLVCVAYYDPTANEEFRWHSMIFDHVKVLYWAKLNLPVEMNGPK